jgi:hypothetical protein
MEVTEHGSSGYRAGCRCFACRLAHKEDAARYRAAKRGDLPPVDNAFEGDDEFTRSLGWADPLEQESHREHLPYTVTAESFKKKGEPRESHTHTQFCAKPCYRGEDYLEPDPGFKKSNPGTSSAKPIRRAEK